MSARVIHETKRVTVIQNVYPPEYGGTSWDVFWFSKGVKCARWTTRSHVIASIMMREDVPAWGEEHTQ